MNFLVEDASGVVVAQFDRREHAEEFERLHAEFRIVRHGVGQIERFARPPHWENETSPIDPAHIIITIREPCPTCGALPKPKKSDVPMRPTPPIINLGPGKDACPDCFDLGAEREATLAELLHLAGLVGTK